MIGQPIELSLLGHGVATTIRWLPTHLKLVMDALLASTALSAGVSAADSLSGKVASDQLPC